MIENLTKDQPYLTHRGIMFYKGQDPDGRHRFSLNQKGTRDTLYKPEELNKVLKPIVNDSIYEMNSKYYAYKGMSKDRAGYVVFKDMKTDKLTSFPYEYLYNGTLKLSGTQKQQEQMYAGTKDFGTFVAGAKKNRFKTQDWRNLNKLLGTESGFLSSKNVTKQNIIMQGEKPAEFWNNLHKELGNDKDRTTVMAMTFEALPKRVICSRIDETGEGMPLEEKTKKQQDYANLVLDIWEYVLEKVKNNQIPLNRKETAVFTEEKDLLKDNHYSFSVTEKTRLYITNRKRALIDLLFEDLDNKKYTEMTLPLWRKKKKFMYDKTDSYKIYEKDYVILEYRQDCEETYKWDYTLSNRMPVKTCAMDLTYEEYGRRKLNVKYKFGSITYVYDTPDILNAEKLRGKYIVYNKPHRKIFYVADTYTEAEQGMKMAALMQVSQEFGEDLNKTTTSKPKNSTEQKPKKKKIQLPYVNGECIRSINNHKTDFENMPILTPEQFMSAIPVKGGEFGIWENETEKQLNLKQTYFAFKDLSTILNLPVQFLTFNRQLYIGWGSRGVSDASAHYEPDTNAINLTKMKGAGTLGHEWMHALDYNVGRQLGYESLTKMYYSKNNNQLPKPVKDLFDILLWYKSPDTDELDFKLKEYQDLEPSYQKYSKYQVASVYLDNMDSRKKGYWCSLTEMFARAGHAYLKDKLQEQGMRNDYLCGCADSRTTIEEALKYKENMFSMYGFSPRPGSEERKVINQAFDNFFEYIRNNFV